jgi:uncharacterized protein (DUF983 family)
MNRQRCPRCGGPVLADADAPPDVDSAAACVNCGHQFALLPADAPASTPIRLPTWVVVSGAFLAAGLIAGVILAALSSVATLGGWLLVALGVGMVTIMGAFEAGYLDGPRRRVSDYLRRAAAK